MLTRREFLATTTTALAPATRAGEAVVLQARPFDLTRVHLLPGPMTGMMNANRRYLLELESDRLLHTFRVNAGLASSAEPLGGWEAPKIELRGHFAGHYLSGCALAIRNTQDERLKSKADAMVAEFRKCQKALGASGYLSAFPAGFFDRLRDGGKVWAPWYTVHKIMAGLLDMHVLCGNAQALDVVEGMARWTGGWTGSLTEAHLQRTLEVEHGGMMEVLANLYGVTKKKEYLETAIRFDHRRVFDPLAAGRDELKGLHVNTQIPKIIGAARVYELTGEKRYHDIADYFWRQVVGHRCYSTGGTSNHEFWRTGPDKLASELSATTQECCTTYNMLKLTRHVFGWTPQAGIGDYFERAFLNGIIGTMNPENGLTEYFVPLESGFWKLFALPRASFWCCTGTGVESFSKLPDSIYFHDDRGLWVGQFIASRLDWHEKGITLEQRTNFPEQENSSFTVLADKPVKFDLRIRVPYWASRGAVVKVNGKAHAVEARPSSYVTLARTWKKNDRVEISLPMSLHAQAMPDDTGLQSFLYGPLVLAGKLGKEGLIPEMMAAENQTKYEKMTPPAPPDLQARGQLADWIRPVEGRPLTFRTSGQASNLTFVPLNRLFGERYGVYWRVRG